MKTVELLDPKIPGLEKIGVSEVPKPKRSKFGMPERSDRRKEREFGEFQGPLRSSYVMEVEGPQPIFSQP